MWMQVPLGWRPEQQEKQLLCQPPPHFLSCLLTWGSHSIPTLRSTPSLLTDVPTGVVPAVLPLASSILPSLLEYSHWHTNMSQLKKNFFFKKKKTLSNISFSLFPLRANFRETVIYTCYLQSAFPCSFSLFNFLNISVTNFTEWLLHITNT